MSLGSTWALKTQRGREQMATRDGVQAEWKRLGVFLARPRLSPVSQLRSALLQHGRVLRPGVWISGPREAHHLTWKKTLSWPDAPWPRAISRQVRQLRHLRLVIRGDRGGATVARLTRDGGSLILAPEAGWVRRTSGAAIYDARYERLRGELASSLRIPYFSVEADGRQLEEEFVRGPLLTDAEPRQLRPALLDLLSAQSSLSVRGYGPSLAEQEFIERNRDDVRQFCHDVGADAARVLLEFSAFPQTLSMGDLRGENVICHAAGPTVIDIDPSLIRTRPFWFDALFLLARSFPTSVQDASVRARVDELWLRLAGADQAPGARELAAIISCWSHPLLRISPDLTTRKANVPLRDHARQQWNSNWSDSLGGTAAWRSSSSR